MEEYPERVREMPFEGTRQMTLALLVEATAAAVIAGGPLLGLMCFCLVATVTLFLISLPLLLISSPVLTGAVAVLAAAMVGFLIARAMWMTGISALVWSGRQIGVAETMVEWMGGKVKKLGQDGSYYLWNKAADDFLQAQSS